jgi:CubicO group peptidase (beta-lactamase class C family)
MQATAAGLAKFGQALLNHEIISPASLTQMTSVQILTNESKTNYGLGIGVNDDLWSHGGSQQGTRTHFLLIPSTKTSVAICCNTEGSFDLTGLGKKLGQTLQTNQPRSHVQ